MFYPRTPFDIILTLILSSMSDSEEDSHLTDNCSNQHPAIAYHTMASNQRYQHRVGMNGSPGYDIGFPPSLCDELGIKVDIDSSIVVRKSLRETSKLFLGRSSQMRIRSTISVNTDIKASGSSFGFHLQVLDDSINKVINKDLSNALSFEIGEISCSDIRHKLHLVIIDSKFPKRTRRDKVLEKHTGVIIADTLEKARNSCMQDPDIAFDARMKLQSLNRPDSNRKERATLKGIASKSIHNRAPPKWNLDTEVMKSIGLHYDLIVSKFSNNRNSDSIQQRIRMAMKNSSFFVVSQAGSKNTLALDGLLVLEEERLGVINAAHDQALESGSVTDMGLARAALESELKSLVIGNPKIKTWLDQSCKLLFPGMPENHPYFIDIGYRFMFPKKPYLTLLADSKKSCVLLKKCIETAQSAEEASSHNNRSGRQTGIPNQPATFVDVHETVLTEDVVNEISSEIDQALDNETDGIGEAFWEDEEEPQLGDPYGNRLVSLALDEAADLADSSIQAALQQMGAESEEEEQDINQTDEELHVDEFESESQEELQELISEAEMFTGPEIQLYQASLAILYSSSDSRSSSASQQKKLFRSDTKPARYLFGTRFGNCWTGYPRLRFSPFYNNPPRSIDEVLADDFFYPRVGPVSCVMYASGLKNTNIHLYNNISQHALRGYGALTKLLTERGDLIEGEWDIGLKKWIEKTNILRLQQANEERCESDSQLDFPFSQSLRMEFRVCVRGGQERSMSLPWPEGLLSVCEVEHSSRYHSYRNNTFSKLFQVLRTVETVWKCNEGCTKIFDLPRGLRNYIVVAASVLENFVNIFASPAANRYSLFKNADELRKFFHHQYSFPSRHPSNILNLQYEAHDCLVSNFHRSEQQKKGIDMTLMFGLRDRVAAIRNGDQQEKEKIKCQRLQPSEKFQRDFVKREYMKKMVSLDATSMILARQKMKYILSTLIGEEDCRLISNGDEIIGQGTPTAMFSNNGNLPCPNLEVVGQGPAFLSWSEEETDVFLGEVFNLIFTMYYHEYDIMIQKNRRFSLCFKDPQRPNLSPSAVYLEAKSSISKIKEAMENSGYRCSSSDGIYIVKPFNGLNDMRRSAGLKCNSRDQAFRNVGKTRWLIGGSSEISSVNPPIFPGYLVGIIGDFIR